MLNDKVILITGGDWFFWKEIYKKSFRTVQS